MHVTQDRPPPDGVAYAEDQQGRLWTGKGAGTWRCLTAAANPKRVPAGAWADVWLAHGPLVPLVPAGQLAVAAMAYELQPVVVMPLGEAVVPGYTPDYPQGPRQPDINEPPHFRLARRLVEAAARSPWMVGKPLPWARGYVWGACGHSLSGQEFRAGLTCCERCPQVQR